MLLAAFLCQQTATMSAYKFTRCCFPRCTTETFGAQNSGCGGANWAHVSRDEPSRKAQRPRTASSQQPACTHKEHQILTTVEATAFAAQFWDRKEHPSKASQHAFLVTCIDVDLEQKVLWKEPILTTTRIRSQQLSLEHCFVLCIIPSSTLC